ncbi:Hypothetical predicted protein [Pelobates cultripes]|uniref:Uncharacterized protein n=1 Tax=Pelobates cultripes TaxID=61616 RepID=A0AAD1RDW7_PELCU|nr:Hypothetical predicted protein [Pelobates cultripes]
MKTKWEIATLKKYVRDQITPRGLRIFKDPSFDKDDPHFMAGWNKLLDGFSFSTMGYIVARREENLPKLDEEINKWKDLLIESTSPEIYNSILREIKEKVDRIETEIIDIKRSKYQRDRNDYETGKVRNPKQKENSNQNKNKDTKRSYRGKFRQNAYNSQMWKQMNQERPEHRVSRSRAREFRRDDREPPHRYSPKRTVTRMEGEKNRKRQNSRFVLGSQNQLTTPIRKEPYYEGSHTIAVGDRTNRDHTNTQEAGRHHYVTKSKTYSDVVKEGSYNYQKKNQMGKILNARQTNSDRLEPILMRNRSISKSLPPDTPPSPSFFRRDLIQNRRKWTNDVQLWDMQGKRQRSMEEEEEREELERSHREKRGKTSI